MRYIAILIMAIALGNSGAALAKAVGSCNTESGCRDLARACGKTSGHTYNPASVSSGVCDDGQAGAPGANGSLVAPGAPGAPERSSFCNSRALCRNLKKTCSGEYTRLTPNAGTCSE